MPKLNLYAVEVKVCATAYIKARTPKEAWNKAKALKDQSPDILDSCGDVTVTGASFDALPVDVSLSPAMTILGTYRDDYKPTECEHVHTYDAPKAEG